jgi:hypothetical protein
MVRYVTRMQSKTKHLAMNRPLREIECLNSRYVMFA